MKPKISPRRKKYLMSREIFMGKQKKLRKLSKEKIIKAFQPRKKDAKIQTSVSPRPLHNSKPNSAVVQASRIRNLGRNSLAKEIKINKSINLKQLPKGQRIHNLTSIRHFRTISRSKSRFRSRSQNSVFLENSSFIDDSSRMIKMRSTQEGGREYGVELENGETIYLNKNEFFAYNLALNQGERSFTRKVSKNKEDLLGLESDRIFEVFEKKKDQNFEKSENFSKKKNKSKAKTKKKFEIFSQDEFGIKEANLESGDEEAEFIEEPMEREEINTRELFDRVFPKQKKIDNMSIKTTKRAKPEKKR